MKLFISLYPKFIHPSFNLSAFFSKCKAINVSGVFTNLIGCDLTNPAQRAELVHLVSISNKAGLAMYSDIDANFLKNHALEQSRASDVKAFFVKHKLKGIRLDVIENWEQTKELVEIANQDFLVILPNAITEEHLAFVTKDLSLEQKSLILWNFYPQRYTATELSVFKTFIANHAKKIDYQAFITLQHEGNGPWAYRDQMPSLEMHRDWPLTTQARHLQALGCGAVWVAEQFLNEADFKALANFDFTKVILYLTLASEITPLETKILLDEKVHTKRLDSNDLVIRSTWSRLKYKQTSIPVRLCDKTYFEPGDVVMLNDSSQNYHAEIQIITKKIKNIGLRNYLGTLKDACELQIAQDMLPEKIYAFRKA